MQDIINNSKEIIVKGYENSITLTPETIDIAETLSFDDPQTILTFGHEATAEVSKFSDKILDTFQSNYAEDSGQLLMKLNKIMTSFDKADFMVKDDKENWFLKLFKGKNNGTDIFNKYNSIGSEIDSIFVQIKKYEFDINDSNNMLSEMYDNNMKYYNQLDLYITAGKCFIEKMMTEKLPQLQAEKDTSDSQIAQINYNNAIQLVEMLNQRIYDLEMAKMVALQTAPQLKLIQNGNFNLIRKINSAFVITLPVFKQGIIQAITLKRQKIQTESMQALTDTTNNMLIKNANNVVNQAKLTERMASESTIKIEVIENTWNTIILGIQEVKNIQNENNLNRQQGLNKIKGFQEKLNESLNINKEISSI